MSKTVWLWILGFIIIFSIYWIIDSRLYDKDLEQDHIRETGLQWKDVKKR